MGAGLSLDQIKEMTVEEMPEDELGDRYPLTRPPANSTLQLGWKRPREREPRQWHRCKGECSLSPQCSSGKGGSPRSYCSP